MEEETRRLRVSEFPDALHDEIAVRLAFHSVGLSSLRLHENVERSTQSGSGTLVKFHGRHAILTADHVVHQLHDGSSVGLLTDFSGGLRRIVFERVGLDFLRLGSDDYFDGQGPDLAVIFLPTGETLASLIAHKNFYDLDRRIAALKAPYEPVGMGFWFLCGVPAEGALDLGPMRHFSNVRGNWALCPVAANPREFEHNGFDYLDLRIPADGPDVPQKLNGVSGSGLWQVMIRQGANGVMRVQDYVLSGVAFFEWYRPERLLRSHGRGSIHERLPQELAARRNP